MAAEQGLANAQSDIGMYYDTGDGVAHDPTKAVNWFRKLLNKVRLRPSIILAIAILGVTAWLKIQSKL